MAGIFGIGHLPGEATSARAKKGLQNLIGMYNQWGNQYFKPGLENMWQMYQNPESTYDRGMWNASQAQRFRQFQNGSQVLAKRYAQMGLGQSSPAIKAQQANLQDFNQATASARNQYMGGLINRGYDAFKSVMGYTDPRNQAGLLQQQYQNGQADAAGFQNALGGLLGVAGNAGLFGGGGMLGGLVGGGGRPAGNILSNTYGGGIGAGSPLTTPMSSVVANPSAYANALGSYNYTPTWRPIGY